MADDNRPTLPSMANPTPTPAPQPRRLSLFGPPVAAVEAFAKEMALINQAPLLAIRAVMELGQEIDDPTVSRPAAPAAEAPIALAAEPTPEQTRPSIGTGLDWQTACDRLIALRRAGESFTSLRDLAARVGCSEGLIRKAIKSDTGLRAWAAEAKRTRRTAPAATGLDHAIRRVPQRREAAPDVDTADSDSNTPADDDTVLQRLIEAASPSERARLHAMPPDQLRSLLRLVGEQHADHDRAPLRKRA
ncbi:MAG: hypothetical protein GC172_07125 [Phycisphaera sp.]|nr:hypothetical protein [Phycisphaera sp.]